MTRSELPTLDGGLWHPWRRKWATERKGMPVKNVAEAGGWRDTATLLRSYQRSDEATLTQVVLEEAHRPGRRPDRSYPTFYPTRPGAGGEAIR